MYISGKTTEKIKRCFQGQVPIFIFGRLIGHTLAPFNKHWTGSGAAYLTECTWQSNHTEEINCETERGSNEYKVHNQAISKHIKACQDYDGRAQGASEGQEMPQLESKQGKDFQLSRRKGDTKSSCQRAWKEGHQQA